MGRNVVVLKKQHPNGTNMKGGGTILLYIKDTERGGKSTPSESTIQRYFKYFDVSRVYYTLHVGSAIQTFEQHINVLLPKPSMPTKIFSVYCVLYIFLKIHPHGMEMIAIMGKERKCY